MKKKNYWSFWLRADRGKKNGKAGKFSLRIPKIESLQFGVKIRRKMCGNILDKIAQANVQNFLTFLSFYSMFLLSFAF